jgi:hypothetical protein
MLIIRGRRCNSLSHKHLRVRPPGTWRTPGSLQSPRGVSPKMPDENLDPITGVPRKNFGQKL